MILSLRAFFYLRSILSFSKFLDYTFFARPCGTTPLNCTAEEPTTEPEGGDECKECNVYGFTYENKERLKCINSHANGTVVMRPSGFEIDFVNNPLSGSAAWFFVIILKFIFTAIFEIKNHVKNFLTTKY